MAYATSCPNARRPVSTGPVAIGSVLAPPPETEPQVRGRGVSGIMLAALPDVHDVVGIKRGTPVHVYHLCGRGVGRRRPCFGLASLYAPRPRKDAQNLRAEERVEGPKLLQRKELQQLPWLRLWRELRKCMKPS